MFVTFCTAAFQVALGSKFFHQSHLSMPPNGQLLYMTYAFAMFLAFGVLLLCPNLIAFCDCSEGVLCGIVLIKNNR